MSTDMTVAQASANNLKEVADVAQLYFDLLYTCDMKLFDRLFLEEACLFTLDGGRVVSRSATDYREILRNRQSPETLGAPREDQLIAVDLASPTQAMIKVRARINQAVFVDYLTLLRAPEGWRIASKTYHRAESA